jgi:putative hydrolase of the HAD superfamily
MLAAGLDVPRATVLKELEEVLAEFTSNYEHHFDKLIQRLRPGCLGKKNPALIVAAGVTAYHDTKFRELKGFDDTHALFSDLSTAGVKLGVITHGWTVKQAEKLVRLGLVPFVDPKAVFISDQIGINKPNPKLYLTALADLGLPANEVMYVGDSPEHDIAPPRSLGMVAVWVARGARRSPAQTGIQADHEVQDFAGLRLLLRERFGLAV